MHILQHIHNKLKAVPYPAIAGRWIIMSVCVCGILVLGIFANHQQASSAGSNLLPEVQATEPNPAVVPPAASSSQVATIENTKKMVEKLAATPSIWPTNGQVTSSFGWRTSPWGGGSELHPGIDIANSMGTPIFATADGVVVQSGWAGGYGNIVQIDHGNGIETIYGHNSRVAVSVGQAVKKGQVISYLGSTGRSTGPHVHYEVRVNGTAVDPIRFLVL